MYEKIETRQEYEGAVLRVILSDPPGNVLDGKMIGEITRCLGELFTGDHKAVVFEGAGKHFSFGASVEEHQKEQAPVMIRAFHNLFKTMLNAPVPGIALVRGQCLGGGMELASFCQFLLAEPGARFGQPEIQLGVFPPVAALILPSIIGQNRADDLILTGRSINAETARDWGLVHSVADDVEKALEDFLKRHILPKSALSLRMAAKAARFRLHQDLPRRLDEMERFYLEELMAGEDANEGIRAFLEKRPPVWKNA